MELDQEQIDMTLRVLHLALEAGLIVGVPLLGWLLKKERDWGELKDIIEDAVVSVDADDEEEQVAEVEKKVKEKTDKRISKRLAERVKERARERVRKVLKKVGQ